MLKALIFDVDGTLIDSERHGHRVAYNRAFSESGLNWNWDEETYGRLVKVCGARERLRYFLGSTTVDGLNQITNDSETLIEDLYQKKTRHFLSIAETGGLSPRPGIERLLHEARQKGLILAIASSSDETNVQTLLRHSFAENIEPWFQYIGAGDTATRKKPDPEIYHAVLQKLGLAARQCLAFEDSEPGLNAALAAGIPTLVTWNKYTRNDCFQGAALVVEHLESGKNSAATRPKPGKTSDPEKIDLQVLHRIHEHWLNHDKSFSTPSDAHSAHRKGRSEHNRLHCVQPTQHS
jgi:HAD superfamily hydrolase (TIGR01509 family)